MLRRIVVYGVIGVAISLLIAVAGSLTAKAGTSSQMFIIPGRPEWAVRGTVVAGVAPGYVRTDLWLDPGPYSVAQRRGIKYDPSEPEPVAPDWIRSVALEQAGPRFAGWKARVAAYGWPRPVLYWIWDWRNESVSGGLDTTNRVGTKGVSEASTAIPWRVMWRGLAVDSLAFGALIGVPITMFVEIRRWRRGRRGRCLGCGYDLSGTAGGVCPECGKETAAGAAGMNVS